jgi:hypothetical protein
VRPRPTTSFERSERRGTPLKNGILSAVPGGGAPASSLLWYGPFLTAEVEVQGLLDASWGTSHRALRLSLLVNSTTSGPNASRARASRKK